MVTPYSHPLIIYTPLSCSIQKQLERAMDGPIDVVKLYQQQEDMKFVSHFGGKFIIHWVSIYLNLPVYLLVLVSINGLP